MRNIIDISFAHSCVLVFLPDINNTIITNININSSCEVAIYFYFRNFVNFAPPSVVIDSIKTLRIMPC
jgi:hypothetical protein